MEKRLLLNLFISEKPEISIFCVNSYKNEFNTSSEEIYAHYIIKDEVVKKNKFFVGTIKIDEYLFEKAFFIVSVKHKGILIVNQDALKAYLTHFFPIDNKNLYDLENEAFGIKYLLHKLEEVLINFSDTTKMFKIFKRSFANKFISFSKLTQII